MKRLFVAVLAVLLMGQNSFAQQPQPFETMMGGAVPVGNVSDAGPIQVGFLTWGGDVAAFVANGGLNTRPDSLYGKAGLNLKFVNGDDLVQQAKDYISGKTPYLRCTTHMAGTVSEVLNKDARTKPVMILQLTWSAGDHLVARENIKTLNDLKGKTICLQSPGPHLGLLDDSLKAAGLSWDDIKVIWAKDLTGSPDSPAEILRSNPQVDACCVISPDMLGLCSGLTQIGSGAEGTVKGAHVLNSTASMSRSIADVYYVRADYYKTHKPQVLKFVAFYLKATEDLLEAKRVYDDGRGKSPKYVAALKLAQDIYGVKTLPTLEADAHGLVSDANFVRIPGNEVFFNDPNNLTGFTAKQNNALELAQKLGYIKQKLGFDKADWDYKAISELAGVKYTQPVYSTGRIKAEVADFSKDLDSNTIFTFEIKFEPEQVNFPTETYAADFKRYCESSATFANAAVVIEGHSDPTLALQHFFWAAKAKGLLTGNEGNYKFNGKPLNLVDTNSVIQAIQSENLGGQKRKTQTGEMVEVPDPRTTVAATLTLSRTRAETVRKAIEEYSKSHGFQIDISQAVPLGVGIADPVNPKPRNMNQAKENMRVVFRVVRVKAEAISPDDFNFERE